VFNKKSMLLFRRVYLCWLSGKMLLPLGGQGVIRNTGGCSGTLGGDQRHWSAQGHWGGGVFRDSMREGDPQPVSN